MPDDPDRTLTDATPGADRWERIKRLVEAVLERPPDERAAFLDAETAGDVSLREEVESLAAAADAADALGALDTPFLGGSPFGDLDAALAAARTPPWSEDGGADPLLGERVGVWQLDERVGAGGMGLVYRAHRADGRFEQTAAVKLLRGVPGPDLLARFRAERQLLARLEHPHIARLLDGGARPDGAPYLAMEFVHGEPITRYCERQGMGVPGRLELFEQVCEAIAYAHRRLVVHRDLKPSNVLVAEDDGGRPQVKLLDFGIAKLLESADAEGAPRTRTGVRAMTPEYAAPEQVAGGEVTTATDVYALGVLLFELLTGRRPFALAGLSPAEMERTLASTEPPRPSAAVHAAGTGGVGRDRAWADRLRGDLDTIVLKALAAEPERRYPTAEALADDLRRHRTGLPVTARPATAGYRVSRFVRRHRAGVAAASVAVLALLVGLGAALWQAREARLERDRARTEAAKAEAVSGFLVSLFEAADPRAEGRDVRVASLLDSAAARLDAGFEGQPEVEARLRATLGDTYRELGLFAPAVAQHRRALALRHAAHGPHHEDVLDSQSRLGMTYIIAGDIAAADSALTAARATARALPDAPPRLMADFLGNLGYVRYRTGDLEASLAAHRESAAAMERQDEPDPVELAATYGNVAIVLADLGRLDEAVPMVERQVAVYRAAYDDDNIRIARALTTLASLYRDLGREAEAIATYDESAAITRRALGESWDLAFVLGHRGAALASFGRYPAAEQDLRESLQMHLDHLAADHPRIGDAHLRLATTLALSGRPEEADEHLDRAEALLRAALPPTHPTLMTVARTRSRIRLAQGRPAEAEAAARAALAIAEERYPASHPNRHRAAATLGAALAAQGRYAEADARLRAAHAGLQGAPGVTPAELEDVAEQLAGVRAATE